MDSFFDFIKEYPPVKRLQVNDLMLAEYQCPLAETRYDIWSHCNYFIYVISGQKKWFTRSQAILAKQGDCLFVRKGAHSVYQYFDSEFCAVVLFVPDEFIRSVLLENRINPGSADDFNRQDSLFSIKPDQRLPAYFHSFLSYLTAPTKPADSLMELKFKELIMMTASPTFNSSFAGYLALLCNTGSPSLRDIMEENYTYPMTLNEFARLCGRSLSAFKWEFQEVYQTSPGRWLRQKRLHHSRHLLEHTSKPVTEILLDSGFKNTSHFSRAFRDEFGTSPLQFRKMAKSKGLAAQHNL